MKVEKKVNLSKKDISKQISEKTGLSFLLSKNLTEDLIDTIKELIKYKDLNIKNFGKFKVLKKKERIGRNPKNNEEFIISSRKVISFYGSKKMNKKLKENKSLFLNIKNSQNIVTKFYSTISRTSQDLSLSNNVC